MKHRIISFRIDHVTEETVKIEHTQETEKALKDILTADYAIANSVVRDAFRCIKNKHTEMELNGALSDSSLRKRKRWSKPSDIQDAFTQNVLNLKAFTDPLATLIEQRMDNTVDD